MNWYKIQLTQQQVANGFYGHLTQALQMKVLLSAADRKTLVQCAAFDAETNPKKDCALTIYISPVLALISPEILAEGSAEVCEAPSEGSVGVLVSWDNKEAAWEVLRSSKA